MQPDSGGVQFFDLVEVDWRSDHGLVAIAAESSGCTDGATGAMSTAASSVRGRVADGRLGRHAGGTGHASRGGWITVIASGPAGSASGPSAWGIMVPES
jgi:hypothetical protein